MIIATIRGQSSSVGDTSSVVQANRVHTSNGVQAKRVHKSNGVQANRVHKSTGVQSKTQVRVNLFSNLGPETTPQLLEVYDQMAEEPENLSNVEPSDISHSSLGRRKRFQVFNPDDLDNGARIPAIGPQPPDILIQQDLPEERNSALDDDETQDPNVYELAPGNTSRNTTLVPETEESENETNTSQVKQGDVTQVPVCVDMRVNATSAFEKSLCTHFIQMKKKMTKVLKNQEQIINNQQVLAREIKVVKLSNP
jgi:hypothetical protein